jgi:hypothetical protein
MRLNEGPYCFEQLHIDVARNSTDDFNPFHDPRRWQHIRDNPFGSTIVLGFQTEFLVSDLVSRQRRLHGELEDPEELGLGFSNFEFRFAGVLKPGDRFDVDVRKTVDKIASGGGLSNRVVVRKRNRDLVLIGTQSDTAEPRFLADTGLNLLPPTEELGDRQMIPGSPYFHKRKFLTTSNGKNFVLAGLGTQQDYFDEIDEFVHFPPVFTTALLSCGLMEKARSEGYDFEADPVVYTSHQISVDRRLQRALRSNDQLHLLIEGPLDVPAAGGLGNAGLEQQLYHVFGVLDRYAILFRARVQMAALHTMLAVRD